MESEITKYLEEQIATLKELHQLLKEEQQAVAVLNTARMDALNLEKEAVQERQRKLSAAGRKLVETLAQQLKLPIDTPLGQLIAKLDTASRPGLQTLLKQVKDLAAAVQSAANENKGMLERFLGTVNESLGFLLRVLNTSNQYGSTGSYIQRTQAGAVMVNREA
jgi:flagellar biosynthesis/type III secretory pathway chaperone